MATSKTLKAPTNPAAALAAIQRKLDRWELEHLRALAASLQDQLEAATRRAEAAEASADAWRDHSWELQEELMALANDPANPVELGLTQSGKVVALRPQPRQVEASDNWKGSSHIRVIDNQGRQVITMIRDEETWLTWYANQTRFDDARESYTYKFGLVQDDFGQLVEVAA